MKTKFILYACGLFAYTFSQAQNYDALEKFSDTKILYDRVFPVSKATELKKEKITDENRPDAVIFDFAELKELFPKRPAVALDRIRRA